MSCKALESRLGETSKRVPHQLISAHHEACSFFGTLIRRQNMEPYRVFISSIMNRSIEDLLAEREAARAAVEHFAPMTVPWAFEAEPASAKPLLDFYIGATKTSDLFVLIIGQCITKPVKDEYETARDYRKPMLVFCKAALSRGPEAEDLLRSLDAKYDSFVNAVELREKIRSRLGCTCWASSATKTTKVQPDLATVSPGCVPMLEAREN
jgi:hypothetical protein